jgi:hypothetical protein
MLADDKNAVKTGYCPAPMIPWSKNKILSCPNEIPVHKKWEMDITTKEPPCKRITTTTNACSNPDVTNPYTSESIAPYHKCKADERTTPSQMNKQPKEASHDRSCCHKW